MRNAAGRTVSRTPTFSGALLMQRALRSILRGLWFVVIPFLLSGLVMRYLVPHALTAPGFEGAFAELAQEHALWLALLWFLLLVGLIRYWQTWLPGGRYLCSLPADLVARVPRRRIAACESASASLAALDRRRAAAELGTWSAERRAALDTARAELGELLALGKWSGVPSAHARLAQLAHPLPSDADFRHSAVFALVLCAVALLALQVRTRIAHVYDVIGTSMLPTLTPGLVLLGDRAAYTHGRSPQRGDVIVIDAPVDGKREDLIKRVVGLPGDRIGMYGVHPIINGWTVPMCDVGSYYSSDDQTAAAGDPSGRLVMEFLENEAYLTFQAAMPEPFSEYVVKPGEVFVLGDNRNNSRDSRTFDHGSPRGFPLTAVRAKMTRILFGRTRSGQIDPALALRPLSVQPALEGVDMSAVQTQIQSCLAQRPKTARAPSAALATLP